MPTKYKNNKTRKNKTRKTKYGKKKGGVFADNDIVNIYRPNANDPIKCFVCGNTKFQRRNATLEKSKVNQGLMNFFIGSEASSVADISIYSYFCNDCGTGIIIRDPKMKSSGIYTKLVYAK